MVERSVFCMLHVAFDCMLRQMLHVGCCSVRMPSCVTRGDVWHGRSTLSIVETLSMFPRIGCALLCFGTEAVRTVD